MKKMFIGCLMLLSGCTDDYFENRLRRIEKLENELLIRESRIAILSDSIKKYNSYQTHFIIKDSNGNPHRFHLSN